MDKLIKDFIAVANKDLSYSYEPKTEFHRLGKRVAKKVAVALGLPTGSYDIRSNLGGVAVSGEVTLHGEDIYIQFGKSFSGEPRIMYRSCKGRKDYTGGSNNFMDVESLQNFDEAISYFQRIRGT